MNMMDLPDVQSDPSQALSGPPKTQDQKEAAIAAEERKGPAPVKQHEAATLPTRKRNFAEMLASHRTINYLSSIDPEAEKLLTGLYKSEAWK